MERRLGVGKQWVGAPVEDWGASKGHGEEWMDSGTVGEKEGVVKEASWAGRWDKPLGPSGKTSPLL